MSDQTNSQPTSNNSQSDVSSDQRGRTMQRPEGVSEERWEQARNWAHEVLAIADWGHDFRVSDDAITLVCQNCDLEHPNDASFDYARCPRYWTTDGELIPRRNATDQPLPDAGDDS